MSKSYFKVLAENREASYYRSFRNRNRMCIKQELKNPEYGDVVFPVYKECFVISRCNPQNLKKEIRDEYFLDIRNILNGYTYHHTYRDEQPCDESFFEIWDKIKRNLPFDGRKHGFGWLNFKPIQKIIKAWEGEPFEALKFLTSQGLIEKAVCLEYKLRTKK